MLRFRSVIDVVSWQGKPYALLNSQHRTHAIQIFICGQEVNRRNPQYTGLHDSAQIDAMARAFDAN